MAPDPEPVLLEILAHMPTDFFHCSHCEQLFDLAGMGAPVHQEIREAYPAEILEEAERIAGWLRDLTTRYGEQLHIQVVDPQSLAGFFKSLRYRIRRYPAFVIDGQTKYTGWETAALNRLLEKHIVHGAPRTRGRGMRKLTREHIRESVRHIIHVAREILYGMTTFDWARDLRRERGEVERLFVLITFGDIIGLPIMPPYYTMRLLPYIVPTVNRWKHSILRERDWTDMIGLIEGID